MSSIKVMSTKELAAKFEAELATGRPVVFQVEDEVVNGMILVHIAQQFSTPIYNLPGTAGGIVSQLFSLQNNGQIVRFIQAVPSTAPTELKEIFTKIGALPEGLNIQVEHSTKPQGKKAYTPMYRNGNWIETTDGKLVFENCQPVQGEPKHNVFASYRISDRKETPEEMKQYVHDTYFSAIEKVTVVA